MSCQGEKEKHFLGKEAATLYPYTCWCIPWQLEIGLFSLRTRFSKNEFLHGPYKSSAQAWLATDTQKINLQDLYWDNLQQGEVFYNLKMVSYLKVCPVFPFTSQSTLSNLVFCFICWVNCNENAETELNRSQRNLKSLRSLNTYRPSEQF